MRKIIIATLFLALLLPVSAFATGSCVQTFNTSYTTQDRISDPQIVIVTLTCTGDSSGGTFPAVTVPISGTSGTNPYNIYGYSLYQVGRTPGTTQPTASYSVTVTDSRGFALDLGALTSNGSASVSQLLSICNTVIEYPIIRSPLTVQISGNSVNSAKITVDLIFKAVR